jgi:hypothetical protein
MMVAILALLFGFLAVGTVGEVQVLEAGSGTSMPVPVATP